MTRPYQPLQVLAIIRECHTMDEVDKATDRLYEHAKTYCLFDLHLISQALTFKYNKLNKIKE